VGVSQTAAFNRGRHLYSAGRPSGWALAHISSIFVLFLLFFIPRLMSAVAGLKCAASGSLKNAGPKKSPQIRNLGTTAQLCRAESSQLTHVWRKACLSAICPPHLLTLWRTSANWRLRSVREFGAPQQI